MKTIFGNRLSGLLALGALAVSANAQLNDEDRILETMKESQGQVINTLGRLYGAAPGELIHFDVTTQRTQEWSFFRMTSRAGQSWQGMNISIDIAGSHNLLSGSGNFGSSLMLGADAWNQDGTFQWNQGGADLLLMDSLATNQRKGGKPDEHTGTEWVGDLSFTWVIHTMDGVPTGEESLRLDYRFRLPRKFNWWQRTEMNTVTGETFGTSSAGSWDLDTGTGEFSAEIVPEPVSLIAITVGLAGLAGRRRARSSRR
ncbi:MAG: hypothetical protein HONBIEJF_01560 [Fimbriimonadaceae bacterium]|nr:hypothetical protein [Fimbriimonadaceae bacterium]